MEHKRSFGAMLITAPTEAERLYEMSVRMARAEMVSLPGYTLHPWLTVRANVDTGRIEIAAGITAKRVTT